MILRRATRLTALLIATTLSGQGLAGHVLAQAPTSKPEPLRFSTVMLAAFDAWDTTRNGALEPAEIDAAVLNSTVTGDSAAAAAAAHNFLYQESRDGRTVLITRQWLTEPGVATSGRATYLAQPPTPDPTSPVSRPQTTRPTPSTAAVARLQLTPQGLFDRARRAIARADRRLFGDDDLPAFGDLRQGSLGDCYLISVLGAQTYFAPEKIKAIVSEHGPSGYTIHWGDGTTTPVPPLTDGELGVGGASAAHGLWVRVLEKGLTRRKLPEEERDSALPRNAIGRGGQTRPIIMLVTGTHAEQMRLLAGRKSQPTAAEIEKKTGEVRKLLSDALPAKRLMAAGTLPSPPVKPPPGMDARHAYAVIGYDAATDRVTVWNPHANDFTPKPIPGTRDGLERGYTTRKGIFTLTLTEFVQAFGSLSWQTPEPLRPGDTGSLLPKVQPASRPTTQTTP